jgi:hypothetical protein
MAYEAEMVARERIARSLSACRAESLLLQQRAESA